MGRNRMIVLDTCGLLWLVQGSGELSDETRQRIDAEPIVGVSPISAYEIALKHRAGKLQLPLLPEEWWTAALRNHRLEEITLTADILMSATRLPPIHRDPADRFIIATALQHNAAVVTADTRFSEYGVRTLL
ncbi:MAG: type II toxin-antitoxin system VapC family toxin [Alkalispirochaeta sp.]